MELGVSRDVRSIFRFLTPEKKEEIAFFTHDEEAEEYIALQSDAEAEEMFDDVSHQFISTLSGQDLETLKHYTGFSYKEINAIMRNKWNYEENGELTPEKKLNYQKKGYEISEILQRCPSLNTNLKVYRGTSLRQFHEYGIFSLSDLKAMEGQYMYESGFTSTSLVRKRSLLGMSNFFTGERNIEIEYLVPACCQDGGLLLGTLASYYDTEYEYLINTGSMSKVLSVEVDEKNKKAFVRALLIPKMLWDPPYMVEETKQNKMG